MLFIAGAWSQDWLLQSKLDFDGEKKIITVAQGITELDIRADLYSSWIDWVATRDHSKFLPAIRYTGLDPVGPGVFTGDVYFLVNGWKLRIDIQVVKVTGVLYSDNYPTAYYTESLIPQYPAVVSALVNTISVGGSSGGSGPTVTQIRQEIDTNSTKLAQIQTSVGALPTALQNRLEMDSNSAKLAQIKILIDSMNIPSADQTAAAVWNTPVSTVTDKSTIGGYITRLLLSIPKFIGLK